MTISRLINAIRSFEYTKRFSNSYQLREGVKQGVKSISKWSVLFVFALVISPVADRYLRRRARREKSGSIFKKMQTGSRPLVPISHTTSMIERTKELEQLQRIFFPHTLGEIKQHSVRETPSMSLFGILVGPSGTGKTVAITHLCNEFPQGIMYCEVREPLAFPATLATEVGMKLGASDLFDLVLNYISTEYALYHKIPQDSFQALNYVISTIQKSAKVFKKAYGYAPTLFIDGADLLAKNDEKIMKHLISHAKILSNEKILRIVLISSEGSVVPLLGDSSHMNRSAKLMEVGDISDKEAMKFLNKYIESEELCAKLVAYIGGRFAYLVQCIGLYEFHRIDDSSANVFELIKKDLFCLKRQKQYVAIEKTKPLSTKVLKIISQNQNVHVKDILSAITHTDTDSVVRVIEELVKVNVLRYTIYGSLDFHGRPERHEFFIKV